MSQNIAKNTVKTFVQTQVNLMQQYAETKYGLKGFQVDLEVKFNTYKSWGGTHHGGHPFVQFGLERYVSVVQGNGICDFNEYPSFAFDKVIGSLINVHWTKAISALVAHEIAHAIQFFGPLNAVDALFSSKSDITCTEMRGHKKLWKNIYKDLRIQFVNTATKIDTPVTESVTKPVITAVTKPVTKTEIKTETTTSKKEWTTKEYRENGGLVVEYIHIASGSLILKVLNRCNKTILVWDPRTNKWVDSGTFSRVELRKRFVETFVY